MTATTKPPANDSGAPLGEGVRRSAAALPTRYLQRATRLESKRTPLDLKEVHARLQDMLGPGPEADFLTAQIALETGNGRWSYNYNVGNMKPRDREDEKYQILTTWENVNGKRVDMNEPFLAHATLEDGLRAYVEYQDRKGHLDAAASGDLAAFNRSLKSKGYYTADEAKYLKILQNRLDAIRGG